MLKLIIVFLLFISRTGGAVDKTWIHWAYQLTGEPEVVRREAIRQLKRDKTLKDKINLALVSENRWLALDVIGALGWQDFIPRIRALVATDRSGLFATTLNSLTPPSQIDELVDFYLKGISDHQSSEASRCVMLDTLGRLRVEIPFRRLREIFKASGLEVRRSSIGYLELQKNEKYFASLKPLIELILEDPSLEIRVAGLFLSAELNELRQIKKYCRKKIDETERLLCEQLLSSKDDGPI